MTSFDKAIESKCPGGLRASDLSILQVNTGRRCNLACTHCHLNCSPDRTEMMSSDTIDRIISISASLNGTLVDITGGAPEMHPELKRLILGIIDYGHDVQVRTNLSILAEEPYSELIPFFTENKVRLVASLPCYLKENVDAQRGQGTYDKDISVIERLNACGYGSEGGFQLNLVYNPAGPFLPGAQDELEAAYRKELHDRFDIDFTSLIAIANMPIGRFREMLEQKGEADTYMHTLTGSFNPETIEGLMCRHQVCIDWDGRLYDCDFNLAESLPIDHGAPDSIDAFDLADLKTRRIVTDEHCFGCTAGAGSSCAGSLAL